MDDYTVSPAAFERQMGEVEAFGWTPITLEDLLAGNPRPRRAVVITFDDGFACNRTHAWPVLARHGFASATFLVTGCTGGVNTWDGSGRDRYCLLSTDDILSADHTLMTFHDHTATHPDLTAISGDAERMRAELSGSRAALARLVATPGRCFAYPYGSWNPSVARTAAETGYSGACTCMEGLNDQSTNPHLLRRVEIVEKDVGHRLRLKLQTGRDLLRWPPERPPEMRLAADWLRLRLGRR